MKLAILGRAAAGSRGASMMPIAVSALEEAGYEVCLPHGMAPEKAKATPAEARAAMAEIVGADGIAVPLWWRECEGAAIERRVAQVMEAFGLTRMMDLTDWIAYAPSYVDYPGQNGR